MESIFMHIINVVVGILIATLWQKIKSTRQEQDAIKAGLQSLLRNEITKSYYLYKDKGWIPLYALQNLQCVHENYQTLGENGVIDGLWSELMALPHTKPEVKKGEKSD